MEEARDVMKLKFATFIKNDQVKEKVSWKHSGIKIYYLKIVAHRVEGHGKQF